MPTAPPVSAVHPLPAAATAITTRTLECGMTLIVEEIPGVRSAALSWLVPAGAATDAADGDGVSAMLSEMILRGAGALTSREHSDALDRLGVNRGTDVSSHHLRIDATMLGERLGDALPLIADMVVAPALPQAHVDAVRSLCVQALDALDDEPQQLAMIRLRERHLAPPFNRHGMGQRDVLATADIDDLKLAWSQRFVPGGSMLGVAGAVNADRLAAQLDRMLRPWRGEANDPQPLAPPLRGYGPIEQATAQVHIGAAWDAPPERDRDSMVERLAIAALSGSTSGRLFSEVRQKRSLCYSVGASYRAGRDTGMVNLYAGTTPERAQQTLDVCMDEVRRLRQGVREDEFHRAVIGLKSGQIMQGESTPARAAALVYDHFRLGRARSLDELAAAVDAITPDRLNAYLAQRDIGEVTLVTIGPEPLMMCGGGAPSHA